ncbi:hypothetical protein Bca52824_078729 [Brassica carinata]|uniref:Uncharacterized protein n=1 Tax=Brassica carinata TaxID=52824 RepID=A0A8X7PYG4_BRACI|nr:hypothetical protein Bca52824_078729 [Brassica carinata]
MKILFSDPPHCTIREGIINSLQFSFFVSSFDLAYKVLFKNEELKKKVKSVIVHVNYHPDKLNRMQAVVEFYVNGKQDALDSLPDGFF